MRKFLLGLAAAAALFFYRPWRYSWAFGQDAGAARSADWKDKPCSRELAKTLYGAESDASIASRQGNKFFRPGAPGHFHFVYGFRSQSSCEAARKAMGNAQWDQSTIGAPTAQ